MVVLHQLKTFSLLRVLAGFLTYAPIESIHMLTLTFISLTSQPFSYKIMKDLTAANFECAHKCLTLETNKMLDIK